MIMKTPNLDHEIQRLEAFENEDDLSEYGKELLTEYEAIKKQLRIGIVSQQRELLKKWWKYFDEESVAVNCNEQEREEVINDFFNCG
jgi:hypothetical protein